MTTEGLRRSPRLAAAEITDAPPALALDAAAEKKAKKAKKSTKKEKKSTKLPKIEGESKEDRKKRKAEAKAAAAAGDDDGAASPPKKKRKTTAAGGVAAATAAAPAEPAVDENGNQLITNFRPMVSDASIRNLAKAGITTLFDIQVATFQTIYDGKDMIGRARTGTGKTLAFSLPVVSRLQEQKLAGGRASANKQGRAPAVLVLAPTRELALQVAKTFGTIDPSVVSLSVYGGASYQPMEAALRRGVDVVVGTCGRIKDMNDKGSLRFDRIRFVIMDEADEMLDQGFADDVDGILSAVKDATMNRERESDRTQFLLFSATLPPFVAQVAQKYLQPDRVTVDLVGNSQLKSAATVTHKKLPCHWSERASVLADLIRVHGGPTPRTIIFAETKKECNELTMESSISDMSQPLHGDITQKMRESTLKAFRNGNFPVLVATDVAARGIDIEGVTLVVQCEPPTSVETYIHRSGRTGRAGKKGTAILFYTPKQQWGLQQIERKGGVQFEAIGVPQGTELIVSAVKTAGEQMSGVHPKAEAYFAEAAAALVEKHGAAEAVAKALAVITGHTQPIMGRSLLNSMQGWVTVCIEADADVRSLSYVWSAIRRWLFENPDDKVRGMRLTADGHGACFDIPCADADKVTEAQAKVERSFQGGKPNLTFSLPAEKLPALVPQQVERPAFRQWGRNKGGGGGRGGGGFRGGSRGGGRGRGRGGGGFRGRR
jgi:ATP-dependent RNA helicase DDX21